MPFTPIFGWPYQSLLQPPDGPNLGEDLALAIEATLANGGFLSLARMGCSLRRVANQNINDVTQTTVQWDTEDVDTHSAFTAPSGTIVVPTNGAGIWAVTVNIAIGAPPTGFSTLLLFAGGQERRQEFRIDQQVSHSITLPLVAGDVVSVDTYLDIAGASTTMTGRIDMYRVAA